MMSLHHACQSLHLTCLLLCVNSLSPFKLGYTLAYGEPQTASVLQHQPGLVHAPHTAHTRDTAKYMC